MARIAHSLPPRCGRREPRTSESAAYRVLRAAGWGFAHIFSILLLAVAWEWVARSGMVTPFMLPTLSAVLERIWEDLTTGDLCSTPG